MIFFCYRYRVLAVVGRIAIVSNAMIIAFSSHFIPKLIYMLKVNPEHTEDGFLQFSLASFNTSDFKPGKFHARKFSFIIGLKLEMV